MNYKTKATIIITSFVGNKVFNLKSHFLHTTFWSRQVFSKNMLSSPSITFAFYMKSWRCNTPRTQCWSSKGHSLTSKWRAHVAIRTYKVRASQSGAIDYKARPKVIGYGWLSHVLIKNVLLPATGQHVTFRSELRRKTLLFQNQTLGGACTWPILYCNRKRTPSAFRTNC